MRSLCMAESKLAWRNQVWFPKPLADGSFQSQMGPGTQSRRRKQACLAQPRGQASGRYYRSSDHLSSSDSIDRQLWHICCTIDRINGKGREKFIIDCTEKHRTWDKVSEFEWEKPWQNIGKSASNTHPTLTMRPLLQTQQKNPHLSLISHSFMRETWAFVLNV